MLGKKIKMIVKKYPVTAPQLFLKRIKPSLDILAQCAILQKETGQNSISLKDYYE